jgi:hypothetical protein
VSGQARQLPWSGLSQPAYDHNKGHSQASDLLWIWCRTFEYRLCGEGSAVSRKMPRLERVVPIYAHFPLAILELLLGSQASLGDAVGFGRWSLSAWHTLQAER